MKYSKDIQELALNSLAKEENNKVSFIWKGISERLDCKLVIGTARAVFKIDDFIPVAVTLYPKDDTEGKLLGSAVIEMRVEAVLSKIADDTLISYIEDSYLKIEAEISKESKSCRH